MAWEWVAPVATALATGTVGTVGIVTTYKSGKRQVDAQVDIAREERQQRRIEAAYNELLVNLIGCDDYANQVFATTMSGQPPHDVPPPPGFSASMSGDGNLAAYWSPRVRQLVEEMRAQLRELNRELLNYHIWMNDESVPDDLRQEQFTPLFTGITDQATRAQNAIRAIRDQTSAELNPGAPPRT